MINKMPIAESSMDTTESQEVQGLTPKEWRAVTDRLAELNEKMIQASSISCSSPHEASNGQSKMTGD